MSSRGVGHMQRADVGVRAPRISARRKSFAVSRGVEGGGTTTGLALIAAAMTNLRG